jgi:HEAT repeats
MRSRLVTACVVVVTLTVMGLPVSAQELPSRFELRGGISPIQTMPQLPPMPTMPTIAEWPTIPEIPAIAEWHIMPEMPPIAEWHIMPEMPPIAEWHIMPEMPIAEWPIIPEIPAMAEWPIMPEMPPMPPMPSMEGFLYTFGEQQRESVDPAVRFQQEVFRTLVRTNADRAMEIATDRLKTDPGDPVVLGNLSTIANSNSTKALPLLISIAKTSTNVTARREAASTIGRTRDKDGLTILEDLYDSSGDSVELRKSIVSSISRSSDPRTVSVLAKIVRSDTDDSIRRSAIQYLGNRKEPEALKVLEDLLKEAPKPRG